MPSSRDEITGPLTEISQAAWQVLSANVPNDLRWHVLLLTLFIASFIWFIRDGHGAKNAAGREVKAGYLTFLFPRAIYTHESARVDVGLWVLERCLRPFWVVGLLATIGPSAERQVIYLLQTLFGNGPGFEVNYAWMLAYSLVILLFYDFVFYVIHITMHKVPFLWAIHKVHHSAEVLTPLTRYREHVMAGPIWAAGAGLSYGTAGAVFAYLMASDMVQATLFNVGFFSLLFGFNGSFRHYHVQFRYPRWLEFWLQSPAMHHTHHSYLHKHWDTNLAAVTSIFDRLFGTLYIPEKDEYTPWGIGPDTQNQYRSLWQNTLGPFRDWYYLARDGVSPQSGAVMDQSSIDGSVDPS